MKILAVTQARSGSTRLPAKVLKTIEENTLLDIHLHRLKKSKRINDLIVATTIEPDDERIAEVASRNGLPFYRGSVNDVLDRFYQAAWNFSPDYVVRITSDCPLIDPLLVDQVIDFTIKGGYDYVSNVMYQRGYPDGEDVEVFKFQALEKAWKEAGLSSEREHVTPYIRNNSSAFEKSLFTSAEYPAEEDYTSVRLTVDEPADFEVIKRMVSALGIDATWQEYTKYYLKNNIVQLNGSIERNGGYKKSLKNDRNNDYEF